MPSAGTPLRPFSIIYGLVLLGLWVLVRRRGALGPGRLPDGLVAGAGCATFGVVGLALLAQGLELLALGPSSGEGADLSAGIVSLVVAVLFGRSLYRTVGDLKPQSPDS